ncbi:MAG: hypothetical protein M3R04_01045 [bacterium]|nr:hypothetical protein [bacterium]
MKSLLAAIAIVLAPVFAFAQEGSLVTYTSLDHGFTIAVPGGGMLTDIYSDPNWVADDGTNTVMRWDTLFETDAVTTMTVTALDLGMEATDADIADFIEGYTGELDSGGESTVDEVGPVFMVENRGWVSVLAHSTVPGGAHFEAFATRHGNYLYCVLFFYPLNDGQGNALARDVLGTFSAG